MFASSSAKAPTSTRLTPIVTTATAVVTGLARRPASEVRSEVAEPDQRAAHARTRPARESSVTQPASRRTARLP